MKFDETKKILQDFVNEVVRLSKKNLAKKKASGKLQRSIKGDSKVNPNSFEMNFEMLPYGAYVDAGVDGKKKRYGKQKTEQKRRKSNFCRGMFLVYRSNFSAPEWS